MSGCMVKGLTRQVPRFLLRPVNTPVHLTKRPEPTSDAVGWTRLQAPPQLVLARQAAAAARSRCDRCSATLR